MKRNSRTNLNLTRRKNGFRPIRLIIVAFILTLLSSSTWQLWKLHNEVSERMSTLNEEKTRLLQEKKRLEEEIVKLNTPSYIEQLAREQLGLVRRGEIMIAPKKQ